MNTEIKTGTGFTSLEKIKSISLPQVRWARNRWKSIAIVGASILAAASLAGCDAFAYKDLPGKSTATPADVGGPRENPLQTATSLVVITRVPEPTATSTPEVSKFVYWTETEVVQAQKEALAQGKVLIPDVWSDSKGTVGETQGSDNISGLAIDNLPSGFIFPALATGEVTSISSIPAAKLPVRAVRIKLNDQYLLAYYFNANLPILTSLRNPATLSSPIIEINNNLLAGKPSPKSLEAEVYILIEDNKTGKTIPLTMDNILTDKQGSIVRLQH